LILKSGVEALDFTSVVKKKHLEPIELNVNLYYKYSYLKFMKK